MGQKKNKLKKQTRRSVIKNITAQRIQRKQTVQNNKIEHSYSQPCNDNELFELEHEETNELQLMEVDDVVGSIYIDQNRGDEQNIENFGEKLSINAEGLEQCHEAYDGYSVENYGFEVDSDSDLDSDFDEDCGFGEDSDLDDECTESANLNDSIVEPQPENSTDANQLIQGRRIVDIMSFIEQLKGLNSHGGKGKQCGFSEMMLAKETKLGLKSIFHFICRECGTTKQVHSNPPSQDSLDLNYASVLASYAIGTGYMQSEEYLGNLEIPFMCCSTYDQHQNILQTDLKQCAKEEQKKAVEEEKLEAIKRGEVDVNNVPLLSVGGDCGWAKRSYKTGYNSNSGAASLVGLYTKKVLWHNIRNKRCKKCERNSLTGKIDNHECNINFQGSPTGMEADIILEGFMESEKLYGVRYHLFIGDGDAKTYKALCDARIYMNPPLTIEKGECRQHIYRGSRGSLIRSNVPSAKITQILKDVKCAVKHWSEQDIPFHTKVASLRKNILCIPLHVFGNHEKCDTYYCDSKNKDEFDHTPSMRKSGELLKIYDGIARCLDNCKSLLKKYSNNRVEQFNGLVVKHTGGKRVDFTSAGSQGGRTDAAVISFNTNRLGSTVLMYKLHIPENNLKSKVIYQLESRRIKANQTKKIIPYKQKKIYTPDENYGPKSEQILDPEAFECRKTVFLEYLRDQQKNRDDLQTQTIGRMECSLWKHLRCQVIMADVFGRICNAKTAGGYNTISETISCNRTLETKTQTRHTANNEEAAVKILEKTKTVSVKECGLFLDENAEFLGASPNGLIDEDGLVLVKCPYPARDMTVNEGILEGVIKLWSISKNKTKTTKQEPKKRKTSNKKDSLTTDTAVGNPKLPKPTKALKKSKPRATAIGTSSKKPAVPRSSTTRKKLTVPSAKAILKKPILDYTDTAQNKQLVSNQIDESPKINKTCEWYYEAQGCLHVTNRMYCLIIVHTNKDFQIERIDKDDNFWKTAIEPKLGKFFNNELLPMIIKKSRS